MGHPESNRSRCFQTEKLNARGWDRRRFGGGGGAGWVALRLEPVAAAGKEWRLCSMERVGAMSLSVVVPAGAIMCFREAAIY